jgi:hypothetical protein
MNVDSLAVVEHKRVEDLFPVSHAADDVASSGISGLDGQVENLDRQASLGT